jgi:hypothetical protein
MLWLKGCPKCNGDLNQERDMYGEYTACLQCGYYLSPLDEVTLYYSAQLSATGRTPVRQQEHRVLAAASAA